MIGSNFISSTIKGGAAWTGGGGWAAGTAAARNENTPSPSNATPPQHGSARTKSAMRITAPALEPLERSSPIKNLPFWQ